MKLSRFLGKSTRRSVILFLIVVATASMIFASSSRDRALAVNDSQPTASQTGQCPDTGDIPNAAVTSVIYGSPELHITLTRQSPLETTLPASLTFDIGSCQYSSDGILHTMAVAPFIKDDQIYLPVRYMGYAIGMSGDDITWDPESGIVSLQFGGHTATFITGSQICYIDGTAHAMDAAPVVVDDHLDIPAISFADAFGYNITWNQEADPDPPVAPIPRLVPDLQGVFVVVDTKIPERLYVYRDTSVILETYCNTGIPEAATPTGLFRIFAKLPSDTMAGTNPDGLKYYDPDVPWVMYFDGGCAIHGFVRSNYGFPQSVGCVELPVDVARKVYDLVHVGTQVYIE